MRRYVPPGSQTEAPLAVDGVRRLSIGEWHELWLADPERWRREIRDRPSRYDRDRWRRAIRVWRNDLPRRASGEEDRERPPLDGVPCIVKDLYDVPGEETTCSSGVLLSGNGPTPPTATKYGELIRLLVSKGMHIAGRSHMNEFAYGLDGRNTFTGDCPHPLNERRISGGSSSGSAWSVASGVVPIALGTDTGGSIRLPAALCGIYGVRLGWSERLLNGVFPLAPSFDTVGWFTASMRDMQRMLRLVPGDEGASSSSPDLKTIGILLPPGTDLDTDMEMMWRNVTDEALPSVTTVETISPPEVLGEPVVQAYNVIGSSEAWQVHHEWIREYGELYDPTVRSLIERGFRWSDEERREAETVRKKVRAYATGIFDRYDAVVLPATVIPTPTYAEADATFRTQILRLNAFASLAGLPALSVPLHLDAIRSGGFQVVVPSAEESRFLGFLDMWEGVLAQRRSGAMERRERAGDSPV
ncbi:MAG: amidase family protein [Alkalispirochaeta sp.]